MTKQQIFNKVVRGLAKQKFGQSMDGSYCAYRGVDGRRCAAGHLILDKHYRPVFNTSSVGDFMVARALKRSGVSAMQIPFVVALQEAHDESKTPKAMKRALVKFADEHGLFLPAALKESR